MAVERSSRGVVGSGKDRDPVASRPFPVEAMAGWNVARGGADQAAAPAAYRTGPFPRFGPPPAGTANLADAVPPIVAGAFSQRMMCRCTFGSFPLPSFQDASCFIDGQKVLGVPSELQTADKLKFSLHRPAN